VSGDPRVEAYAKLLVEKCIDVQPGWQVIVRAGVLARPLIEHYRTQRVLVPEHADGSPNEVFAEIQAALEQVAVR
jgi:leucyl aminopeptidase (aminopeptidase T)